MSRFVGKQPHFGQKPATGQQPQTPYPAGFEEWYTPNCLGLLALSYDRNVPRSSGLLPHVPAKNQDPGLLEAICDSAEVRQRCTPKALDLQSPRLQKLTKNSQNDFKRTIHHTHLPPGGLPAMVATFVLEESSTLAVSPYCGNCCRLRAYNVGMSSTT